jgi:uncharacterized protein (TIGR02145 family)
MKAKIILVSLLIITGLMAFGQRTNIELTFTAENNGTHVQLDSIKVMNRIQGGDTVLYYPDTVLVLDYSVGIPEPNRNAEGFQVFQNYPNPVTDQTTISLYVPEKDKVSMMVTDILGRIVIQAERLLENGTHSFRFTPGNGNINFFTAQWRGNSSSIKILQAASHAYGSGSLEYIGSETLSSQLKATNDIQSFSFSIGDELLYIGYADGLQSGMLDAPEESQTYIFQFATNIPCPGTPTVEYEGQVYNTIQVFSQCWLKENLNVGTMIMDPQNQTDNGTIEKYCYNNEPDSCTNYGGLYQWNEMMQYSTQQGAQGICPPGWHLPTDEEWKVLEGAVDSQYGIGDPEWDTWGACGSDASENLKSTSGWNGNGNGTDLYGFSGLPCGHGGFISAGLGEEAYLWTSTECQDEDAWNRVLIFDQYFIWRDKYYQFNGYSVRCLRDEGYIAPIELTFTAINNTSHIQLDRIKVINRTQGGEAILFWPDTTLVIPDELVFDNGDTLLYIGYIDNLESGILDSPEESETYTFQFATNIPCPGTPTVEYEGQVYNTIQIFSQCWLKEDLNVGTMIQATEDMTDNGVLEKYCYNDNEDSCTRYGGLYQWHEMMQYTTQQGTQGICPPGWHLPTNDEWKVLEGAVDSHYGIGNPEWDIHDEIRGYNAGTNLKTTSGWYEDGNGTDLYGFSGQPAGFRGDDGHFWLGQRFADWWTSTKNLNAENWDVNFGYNIDGVGRFDYSNYWGFRVRCVKNE